MNRRERRTAIARTGAGVPAVAPVVRQLFVQASQHRQAGRLVEAALAYQQAIALDPEVAEIYVNLGSTLREIGRLEDAAACFHQAIMLKPKIPEAHYNLGIVQAALGRPGEAVEAYRNAIALKPGLAAAHCNLGNVLAILGRKVEAAASYRKGLALAPSDPEMHNNLGSILDDMGNLDEAIGCYRQAVALKPHFPEAVSNLTNAHMMVCDWQWLAEDEAKCRAFVRSGVRGISPFVLLSLSTTLAERLSGARLAAAAIAMETSRLPPVPRPRAREKIRLAYLSGDFRQHAVADLTAEMFERHDRDRFEVSAYSFGPDDGSAMHRRLQRAFDRFVDIRPLAHADAAKLIRDDGIDILVDLVGYTKGARTAIVARRPAPIQVNFLGYIGSMGAAFIDYVIADAVTLPMTEQPFYDERIVQLPGCFMPSDTKREFAAHVPTRAECGLPEAGFVFCCFNKSYKITPVVFDIWMRLLRAVPGSVLWLYDANPAVRTNLGREAATRGVAAERLVFAPFQDVPAHLARHRLADLFLDTLLRNAHTTANLALWTGLPVLTCAGDSFNGRAAASLLHCLGLPELVTHSLDEYEASALALATDPVRLGDLRRRLADAHQTSPLFDMARYTRNIEKAYLQMWTQWEAGKAPEPITVAP